MKRAVVGLILACACGGAPPPPAATIAPVPSATSAATPRDPIATMWPISQPDSLVRVDVAGLRATKLGSAMLPLALEKLMGADFAANVPPSEAQCIRDAAAAARDVVLGTEHDGGLVIVRYDATRLASPGACLAAWRPTDVAGARQAWADMGSLAAIASPGVFVAGSRGLVERALRGVADGRTVDAVALRKDEYARAIFAEGPARGHASLVLSDALFALRADADVPEALASAIVSGVDAQRRGLQKSADGAAGIDAASVDRLLHAVTLTRTGEHVSLAFELREPPKDQAQDIGTAATLASERVQKYLLESKAVEARANLGAIGRSLAEWWERAPAPRGPRHRTKLVSFPPVPKTVPRGTTYASTPDDWKPWAALRFQVDRPQRYQYEIRAARDGKSADVIARGDLNGDGKTSTFTLHVRVEPKTHSLVFDPKPTEVDPDE